MKKAVILFTRVPRAGATKTRLLPVISPEQCAELHWSFLKDLGAVYNTMDAHLFISYAPDPDWELLKTVFPSAGYLPQKGADLGQKMYRAIKKVLDLGYESVILTGSDLPLLTTAHLQSGFDALECHDITIGPTSDGGYYLIGMKQPHREVFRVDGYGGTSVLENTLSAADAAGLSVGIAQHCDDVDTPEDLHRLFQAADPSSHTGQYLNILKQEGMGG